MQSFVFSKLNLPSASSVFGSLLEKDNVAEAIKKNISKAQEELNKSYSRLSEDQNLLCTLYRNFSKDSDKGLGVADDIKKTIREIKDWKEEMEDALFKYATTGWGSGKTIEEMFNELLDPFLAAFDPLQSIVSQLGLDQIPIINTLPQMIQSFSNLGRIINSMPSEIKNEARRQAKEAKEAEKEKKAKDFEAYNERVGGNKTWNYIAYTYNDDSLLKKIIDEIVEAFKAVIEMIKTLCSCAEIFAILLIIDKFKPVIDQFKIMIGDAVVILENVETLFKMLIQGEYAMLKFFGKLLWSKVEDIYNILTYVCSGRDLPSNALISGCWMDIVSAQCDISSATLSVEWFQNAMKYHSDEKAVKSYSDKIDEVKANIEQMNSESVLDSEKIQAENERLSSLDGYMLALKNVKMPKDYDKLMKSIDESMVFDARKEKIYAAELAKRTSEDEYLNPLNKDVASGNRDVETGKFVSRHRTGR